MKKFITWIPVIALVCVCLFGLSKIASAQTSKQEKIDELFTLYVEIYQDFYYNLNGNMEEFIPNIVNVQICSGYALDYIDRGEDINIEEFVLDCYKYNAEYYNKFDERSPKE